VNNSENTSSAIEKMPSRDPGASSEVWPIPGAHIRLVLVVTLSVFCCEIFVMMVIMPLFSFPLWFVAVFDALVLIILLCPVLYLFLFRPLVQNFKQRERSREVLAENESRFRTVFETSPDAVIISRLDDGLFIEVNRGFNALSGYAADEIIGKSALEINIWHDPQERQNMVAELQRAGRVENLEVRFNRKGGNVRAALVSANVIMLGGTAHIMAVVRDITDLKITQQKLEASHRFLLVANRNTEMNPLLREFTREIRKLIDCAAVGIRILDQEGNIPYHAYEGFGEEFYKAENPLTIGSMPCMCANIILGRTDYQPSFVTEAGTFYINSTTRFLNTISREERQKTCDICNSYGYESVALVPIRLRDRIIGLVHLADPRENMFPSEAMESIEGATMQLGTAIERVRIEEALKESHRELENRVKTRTAELVAANQLLNQEIQERRQTEKELLANQEKLRILSAELLLTEERERRRIATELHDRIGQTLAISKIKLGEVREAAPSQELADALNQIREFIEQTIRDTRSLTFELSPPTLYELGLESALQGLVEQICEHHGLRIEFSDDQQPKPLDDSCRVVAYMAVRELLFNVVKHAAARSVRLAVEKADETLRICIADDGVGFDPSEVSSRPDSVRGFGLYSIRERLGPLRGQLEIDSEPGKGTRVTIVLPLTCQIATEGNQQP
jgi:PAS domain S-box-containing protein